MWILAFFKTRNPEMTDEQADADIRAEFPEALFTVTGTKRTFVYVPVDHLTTKEIELLAQNSSLIPGTGSLIFFEKYMEADIRRTVLESQARDDKDNEFPEAIQTLIRRGRRG